ncbi:14038_t:CDS:2, partial [Acaulospora colombiana]
FFSSQTMRDFQKTPSIQALMLTRSAYKEKPGQEMQSARPPSAVSHIVTSSAST